MGGLPLAQSRRHENGRSGSLPALLGLRPSRRSIRAARRLGSALDGRGADRGAQDDAARDAEAAGARPLAVRAALRRLPRTEGGRPRSTRRAPRRSTDELHPRRLQAALHADRLDSDRPRSVRHPDPGRSRHADASLEGVERRGALGARVSGSSRSPSVSARSGPPRPIVVPTPPEGRPRAARAGGRAVRQARSAPVATARKAPGTASPPALTSRRSAGRCASAISRRGRFIRGAGDGGPLPHAARRHRRDADGRLRHASRRRDLGAGGVRSLAGSPAPAVRAPPARTHARAEDERHLLAEVCAAGIGV